MPRYKPFCSLECNREYHDVTVAPDYYDDGACTNCGQTTEEVLNAPSQRSSG